MSTDSEFYRELQKDIQEIRNEIAGLRTALAVDNERHVYCRDHLVPQLAEDVKKLKEAAAQDAPILGTLRSFSNRAGNVLTALFVTGFIALCTWFGIVYNHTRR